MLKEFLMVSKDVLPKYYEKIVLATRMIQQEDKKIIEVCRELDISRSTYYKYKDKVFELSASYGKKAMLSFRSDDEKGVLSNILNAITQMNGNILTINQDMPIHRMAYITITLEIQDLKCSIFDLVNNLKNISKVKEVKLLALE